MAVGAGDSIHVLAKARLTRVAKGLSLAHLVPDRRAPGRAVTNDQYPCRR
jgi:hypothetical protein